MTSKLVLCSRKTQYEFKVSYTFWDGESLRMCWDWFRAWTSRLCALILSMRSASDSVMDCFCLFAVPIRQIRRGAIFNIPQAHPMKPIWYDTTVDIVLCNNEMTTWITVFLDVTVSPLMIPNISEKSVAFIFKGSWSNLPILHWPWNLEDKGKALLWNVGNQLTNSAASHTRRLKALNTPPSELTVTCLAALSSFPEQQKGLPEVFKLTTYNTGCPICPLPQAWCPRYHQTIALLFSSSHCPQKASCRLEEQQLWPTEFVVGNKNRNPWLIMTIQSLYKKIITNHNNHYY